MGRGTRAARTDTLPLRARDGRAWDEADAVQDMHTLLPLAVEYALGRITYAADDVSRALSAFATHLDPAERVSFIARIDQYESAGRLGDQAFYGIPPWFAAREQLRASGSVLSSGPWSRLVAELVLPYAFRRSLYTGAREEDVAECLVRYAGRGLLKVVAAVREDIQKSLGVVPGPEGWSHPRLLAGTSRRALWESVLEQIDPGI